MKLKRVKISFEILVSEDAYDESNTEYEYHIFNGIPDMFGVDEVENYTLEAETEAER